MRSLPALLVTVVVGVTACEQNSLPAGVAGAPASNLVGRTGETVTVPMQVDAVLYWTVDQGPAALAACSPRPGLAVSSGEGHGTHLGHFRVVVANHCSVDLAVVPPLLDGAGPFEWMAEDGSTIAGSYEFLFLPPEAGGCLTMRVDGGTGRFAGATGRLDPVPARSGVTQCEDPLCLNGATLPAHFSGPISITRP